MNNIIILIFMVIMGALFLMSLNSKKDLKNEIISLGILGTFVGIAIGLYHFDVYDIKKSMPLFLDGLKTAFLTSIIGMILSIFLGIIKNNPSKEKSEAMQALEMVVREFNNNLTEQFGDNFKQLNESVKNMIIWQENYKNQISTTQAELNNILEQLKKIELAKVEEKEAVEKLITNLADSSNEVKENMVEMSAVVKEQMQLLIREANRKL